MNLEKWNSRPKDIQQIITETTEAFYEESAIGLWDRQNEDAFDFAVNDQKMEVLELSEEEAAKWIDKVTPIHDQYNQKLKELNIDTDALKIVKDLADRYNSVYE